MQTNLYYLSSSLTALIAQFEGKLLNFKIIRSLIRANPVRWRARYRYLGPELPFVPGTTDRPQFAQSGGRVFPRARQHVRHTSAGISRRECRAALCSPKR